MQKPDEIHVSRRADADYEFNPKAVEITILNTRGRVVWRKRRDENTTSIRWSGLDLAGARVEVGSYTCKIRYLHVQREIYFPFVYCG